MKTIPNFQKAQISQGQALLKALIDIKLVKKLF